MGGREHHAEVGGQVITSVYKPKPDTARHRLVPLPSHGLHQEATKEVQR